MNMRGSHLPHMKINSIRDMTTILTSKRFSESAVYLMRLLNGCDIQDLNHLFMDYAGGCGAKSQYSCRDTETTGRGSGSEGAEGGPGENWLVGALSKLPL